MKMSKAFLRYGVRYSRVGGSHEMLSEANPKTIRHCEVRSNLKAYILQIKRRLLRASQ